MGGEGHWWAGCPPGALPVLCAFSSCSGHHDRPGGAGLGGVRVPLSVFLGGCRGVQVSSLCC